MPFWTPLATIFGQKSKEGVQKGIQKFAPGPKAPGEACWHSVPHSALHAPYLALHLTLHLTFLHYTLHLIFMHFTFLHSIFRAIFLDFILLGFYLLGFYPFGFVCNNFWFLCRIKFWKRARSRTTFWAPFFVFWSLFVIVFSFFFGIGFLMFF